MAAHELIGHVYGLHLSYITLYYVLRDRVHCYTRTRYESIRGCLISNGEHGLLFGETSTYICGEEGGQDEKARGS